MNLPPLQPQFGVLAMHPDFKAAIDAYGREVWNAALEAAANACKGDGSKAAIRALRMK